MHSEISVTNGAAHSVDETALIAIQIADNSESVLRLRAAASREGLTASRQVDPLQRPVIRGFKVVLGELSFGRSSPEGPTLGAPIRDVGGSLRIRPRQSWADKIRHFHSFSFI